LKTDEDHIIDGLLRGKESAYRDLYDMYYKRLVVFAFRYLEDLESSRDVVQGTFVKIYENRGSMEIHTSLKSYLFSMVRNQCLNHIKHFKLVDMHMESTAEKAPHYKPEQFDQDIEEAIDAHELEYRINRIIDCLPEKCGRIFRMSRHEHHSNQEIANILGISKRTVETQISKALKTLREKLL
jgi:RNA polymerase sigma-70 factor (ECF subfamily)